MAPEQALMQSVTPACDIYSLGAVLYRMLVGDVFNGTTRALLDHHIHSTPGRLSLPPISRCSISSMILSCSASKKTQT